MAYLFDDILFIIIQLFCITGVILTLLSMWTEDKPRTEGKPRTTDYRKATFYYDTGINSHKIVGEYLRQQRRAAKRH